MRVSQGFWGTREHWQNIEGNKGTLANFWEQGNKIRKITVRKHSENVWEHENIGQFWNKGIRTPPGRPSRISRERNEREKSLQEEYAKAKHIFEIHPKI